MPSNPLKVHLIGVAGTSRDILLAVFALKSAVLADPALADRIDVAVTHRQYVLPADVKRRANEIAAEVLARRPDVAGFSTYTWNLDISLKAAGIVKRRSPETVVVLGGPEIDAGDIAAGRFDDAPVDHAVVGEGEEPLRGLLRWLSEGARGDAPVQRLASRRGGRLLCDTPVDLSADLVEDLDSLPSPYLTGAVPRELLRRPGVQASIETQRGCNMRCAYCLYHANFRTLRYRDVETVLDEINLVHSLGVTDLRITDANFLSDRTHALRILQGLIHREVRASLFVEAIPSFVDDEVADHMSRYRQAAPGSRVLVGIGLQTTNMPSLRAIRRRIPVRQFSRAYDLLEAAGVTIKTDVIVGLPYETKESYYRTIDFVAGHMRTGPTFLSIAVLRALPGTELAAIAAETGLRLDGSSDHFVYETPTMPRADMVDCLRLSTAAVRVLHTEEDPERAVLRDEYVRVHDQLGVPYSLLLQDLADAFVSHLGGTEADMARNDYPNAEHYWEFDVGCDIPNEFILERLRFLSHRGRL